MSGWYLISHLILARAVRTLPRRPSVPLHGVVARCGGGRGEKARRPAARAAAVALWRGRGREHQTMLGEDVSIVYMMSGVKSKS